MSPPAGDTPHSLLVVRLGAMGDVVHTLAAVSALRLALPNTQIGWIIEARWAELLRAEGAAPWGKREAARPVVDTVHAVDTKRWRKSLLSCATHHEITSALKNVREEKYEIAVDFQGSLKSAMIARLSKPGRAVGMKHPRESLAACFYHRKVETSGKHVMEQYQSLAEGIAGMPLPNSEIAFPVDESAEASTDSTLRRLGVDPPFVLITPGAGWEAKRWPSARYGQVAKALAAEGLQSVINYAPQEAALANAVEEASGSMAKAISCSIGELVALTRRATLFIGGDTGPLHLAAALRVPVVAIFGPTDPARNGPYGTRSVVLRNSASRTSLSHVNSPDPGLMQLSAAEVVAAARRLLEFTQ